MKLLMKEDTLPTTAPPPPTPSPSPPSSPSFTTLLGKDRFKLFALAALLLLALWSMFAGSLTLNSSPTNPSSIPFNDDIGGIGISEFDVLEVVEREKVVRHLWNVYTLAAGSIRLPRFWQQAFEAAYENLISDVEAVRDAAVEEIARMSLGAADLARSMETQVGVRDH
ncbi:hypothetical protein Droror1_Dr00005650 [Drosera rotundifolia]